MQTARLRIPVPEVGSARYGVRCVGFSKRLAEPQRWRELPSSHLTLMFGFGDPLRVVSSHGGETRTALSFVSGLQTRADTTERSGHQFGLHVQLSPLAAGALFGRPVHELTDELVDLPSVLGPEGPRLAERLESAVTWADRFALVQAAIAPRIALSLSPHAAVIHAWQQLRASHGTVRIEHLVAESGLSHRHFIHRFREQIGVTPKQMARVLRFEHALDLLTRPGASAAAAALAAGYCDQPHISRDFRALAGAPLGVVLAAHRARNS